MAWRKDLDVVNGLYSMVVLVVVDLAEDLVLDDLVFVWFDYFVCHSCKDVSRCLTEIHSSSIAKEDLQIYLPGAH